MDTSTSTADLWVCAAIHDHLPALQRYARSLVRDADEAEDLCQEACVRLLVAARSGQRPDAPGAWLNRIVHNLVVSNARHRAVVQKTASRLVDGQTVPAVDAEVLEREREAEVLTALAAARPDDRQAILLASDGHRTREIAARLGRSELATRALLCRARARVRRDLLISGAI